MNICIIGSGLSSLSLAKNLVKKKIKVDLYENKKNLEISTNRTLGISKNNIEYFEKNICVIPKKFLWEINKIEIFSEKEKIKKILNFEKKKMKLFFMIKNNDLYKLLIKNLLKKKIFKKKTIKNDNFFLKLIKKNNYDLIINCDNKNFLSKKYFSKKIRKNYDNIAYTLIIEHESRMNNTASQIFTKYGPLAFLPISRTRTSIVYSVNTEKKILENIDIINLVKKYNQTYTIIKFSEIIKFDLNFLILRDYSYKNILAFGDCLHKIHPLAGQGFNMIIRDIKMLTKIIQDKIDIGLQIDSSVSREFEMQTKKQNILFSSGIDFIYEAFNKDRKVKNSNFNKLINFIGKNKSLTNMFIKIADGGIRF